MSDPTARTLTLLQSVLAICLIAVGAVSSFYAAQAQSTAADTRITQGYQAADSALDKRVTNIEQLNELKVNRDIQELRTDLAGYKAGQDEIRKLLKEQKERSDAMDEVLFDIRRLVQQQQQVSRRE